MNITFWNGISIMFAAFKGVIGSKFILSGNTNFIIRGMKSTIPVQILTYPDEAMSIQYSVHGPLARYVKSRAAHAPGMPETFLQPSTSKKTAS